MSEIVITREELHKLVWTESMVAITKKYKISDLNLRKICTKMNVPLPKNGHWQNVRLGKSVKIALLPSNFNGDSKITLELREEADMNNPLTLLQEEIKNDITLLLEVPTRLTNPDDMIIQAKNSLKKERSYNGVISCNRDELRIIVSPGNVDRALLFMDTFIKALKKRGHKITIVDFTTYAVIEEERIEISFREKSKRFSVVDSNQTVQYGPTGIVVFKMKAFHVETEWKDGKEPLEKQLYKILAKLELKGKELKNARISREKYWAEQAEIKRQAEALELRKAQEIQKFEDLMLRAKRWHQVTILRNYLDSLKAAGSHTEEQINWIDWAYKKADWYDPDIEATDELLTDRERNKLAIKSF